MSKRTKLSEAEIAFVHRLRAGRLGTSNEEGSPHVVPVCYAYDGMRFYIPLDEKPKAVPDNQLRRVRNIEARHEASLLIDQYDDDWSKLGYILIHGHAELIQPAHEAHVDAIALLRMRYQQYRSMLLEQRPMIMITPDHITSWGPAIKDRSAD
jgi:PPOX class probable F420-dependent enzyme